MTPPLTITCVLLAAVTALPGRHVNPTPRPLPWQINVTRTTVPASLELPARSLPAIRGQMVSPMGIEPEDRLGQATMVQVRVRNPAGIAQVLRWDVARDPKIVLSGGGEVRPLGHKLHGLSAGVLAVSGVLEVTLPPHGVYDLYPVYLTTTWARARHVRFQQTSAPIRVRHRARAETLKSIATGTD